MEQRWTMRRRAGGILVGALAFAIGGVCAVECAWADVVHFQNGDRLSGRLVEEQTGALVLDHAALGTVTIQRASVAEIIRDDAAAPARPPEAPGPLWEREITLGYDLNRGNTDDEDLAGTASAHRKTSHDEWIAKVSGDYASSDRSMNTQRYDGMVRYAFSFGKRLAWYNFYTLEASHDRFANVDWRLIPSTGIGYWFADQEEWKAMTEVGLGLERTNVRGDTASDSELVVVPRAFAQKTLWGRTTLSQELQVFPSLSDAGEYRLSAVTEFTQPLASGLSLRLTFADAFDSDPAVGARDNDARLSSSLVYAF